MMGNTILIALIHVLLLLWIRDLSALIKICFDIQSEHVLVLMNSLSQESNQPSTNSSGSSIVLTRMRGVVVTSPRATLTLSRMSMAYSSRCVTLSCLALPTLGAEESKLARLVCWRRLPADFVDVTASFILGRHGVSPCFCMYKIYKYTGINTFYLIKHTTIILLH